MNLKLPRWTQSWQFPLVPKLSRRAADEQNPYYFDFRWLMFRIHSFRAPYIGFGVALNDERIGGYINLWRVSVDIYIPFPRFVSDLAYKHLRPKTLRDRY